MPDNDHVTFDYHVHAGHDNDVCTHSHDDHPRHHHDRNGSIQYLDNDHLCFSAAPYAAVCHHADNTCHRTDLPCHDYDRGHPGYVSYRTH